ncbi:hypothetical protein ACGFX8_19350 [Streptomyces sp. NPDC048362]|uniref:hypothetical protein n=1 Tax=Streptomyces sp. NPDC048362 TaxID=3365539 RepID=UPI00372103B4
MHHAARQTGEHFAVLLDSVTLPDVDVTLIYADAIQTPGSARSLDVLLYARKGHGFPDADTSDSLSAVALVLDVIKGHEVKGFGSVSGGALVDSYGIREGLALHLRLDVEGDPNPRFPLDERAFRQFDDNREAPEAVAA